MGEWVGRATGPPQEFMMDDIKPWERQAGENDREYTHFLAYLGCGEGRTLTNAYREYWRNRNKHKPQAWVEEKISKIYPYPTYYTLAERMNWKKRAAAYDIFQRESRLARERADEERLRTEARDNRRNLLNGSLGTLATALNVMNRMLEKHEDEPVPLEIGSLMRASTELVRELRTEFGDNPKTKIELTGAEGGPVQMSIEDVRAKRLADAQEAMAVALGNVAQGENEKLRMQNASSETDGGQQTADGEEAEGASE